MLDCTNTLLSEYVPHIISEICFGQFFCANCGKHLLKPHELILLGDAEDVIVFHTFPREGSLIYVALTLLSQCVLNLRAKKSRCPECKRQQPRRVIICMCGLRACRACRGSSREEQSNSLSCTRAGGGSN